MKPSRSFSPLGVSQIEMGKTEINGDAAPFLFLQAIGINPGKGLDQRGFAVIDVTGGADDDGVHRELV